jgi:general secretion pathway protein M
VNLRPAFLDRLSPREQRLVGILGVVLAVLLLLALPLGLEGVVASRRSDSTELKDAIAQLQTARSQVRERQAKKEALAARYGQKAPALAGMLEKLARDKKLEISDTQDRPELPIGKQFVERTTVVHLKKAGMFSIAKFVEAIEQSGYPVVVSRLSVRKRGGEPDSFDVELGVSAYDRKEQPKDAKKDKTDTKETKEKP